MLELRTDRLLLREYTPDDAQAVFAFAADPEVARFRIAEIPSIGQVQELVQHKTQKAQQQPRMDYELAVVNRNTQMVIGEAELFVENFHHAPNFDGSQARIGYALARPFWGQGFASEIVRELLRFGFDELRLHRIYAPCVPENTGSVRVLTKAGLRQEGHFKSSLWMKGQWRDVLLFAVLAHEWRASVS